jgi:hypothetical protein
MVSTKKLKEKTRSLMSKEITTVAGRSITVVAIVGVLLTGGASAALLNQFGVIQLTQEDIDVEQAILVGNDAMNSQSDPKTVFDSGDMEAGESRYGTIQVENQAGATAPIAFTTNAAGDYSANFTGAVYKYGLVPVESSNGGVTNVTTLKEITDQSNLDSIEDGMVTRSQMVVETSVDGASDTSEESLLGTSAGMQFAVEPVGVEADGSGNLDLNLSIGYMLGGDHTPVDEIGRVSQAVAPNTVEFTVENTDYTEGDTTYDNVTLVYRSVETPSGEQVQLNNPRVFDNSGNQITASLQDVSELGTTAQLTGVSIRTEAFNSTEETLNVVYDSVEFEGSDLINQSIVTVDQDIDSDTPHRRTITLAPETRYKFGALMDTSVYLDPSQSTFDLQTELDVPSAAAT